MKQLLIFAAGMLLAAPASWGQTTAPAETTPAATTASAATSPASIPAGQRKAAEELLAVMQMQQNTDKALDQMMTAQLAQRPELKPVEGEMRAFLTKYMSWAALKEDMVSLYAREFSEKELRELKKFYASSTGQKFVGKQSALMAAGMEIGQRRLQEHMPELQQTIMSKMKPAQE